MSTVGAHDVSSRATTTMALGLVRAAQGRDEEAEAAAPGGARAMVEETGYCGHRDLGAVAAGGVPAGARGRRTAEAQGWARSEAAAPKSGSRRAVRSAAQKHRSDRLTRRLVRRLRDHRRRTFEPRQRLAPAAPRAACPRRRAGAWSRCGSRTAMSREVDMERARPARARRPRASSTLRERSRVGERAVAWSRAGARSRSPGGPSRAARDDLEARRRAVPSSRTRPITSTPNGTARSLPSSRSRSSPSCSTTASRASSRVRPSRKPGWKTTSSAPQAIAMPAEWSSMPIAIR